MLDSLAIEEVEARNPRTPELEAEALATRNLDIETLDSIPEMEWQTHIAELEGRRDCDGEVTSVEVPICESTSLSCS